MSLNIGIIGLGGVGETLLKAFIKHPELNVVSVYDNDVKRMEEISLSYNIPSIPHYDLMLKDSAIHMVYLAVPPKFHHSIALDIIRSGKHIFCEKPLANSIEEANDLVEEVVNSEVKHIMNFPTIYRPSFKTLAEKLEAGLIGEPIEVVLKATFQAWPRSWQKNSWITSREQGGFIKEVFPHYIQMMMQLFGEILVKDSTVSYPEDPLKSEISVYAKGSVSHIPFKLEGNVDPDLSEEIRFSIKGSKGTLTLYNWAKLLWTPQEQIERLIELEHEDHMQRLLDSLVDYLHDNPTLAVTFHEGLKIQKVLEDIVSVKINNEVLR